MLYNDYKAVTAVPTCSTVGAVCAGAATAATCAITTAIPTVTASGRTGVVSGCSAASTGTYAKR